MLQQNASVGFVNFEGERTAYPLDSDILPYALQLFVGPREVFFSDIFSFDVCQGLNKDFKGSNILFSWEGRKSQIGFL